MSRLLEEILSDDNLDRALKAVKANKGPPGVDGMKVSELEDYLTEHREEILEKLRQVNLKPPYIERYVRWCERSELNKRRNFYLIPPTRFFTFSHQDLLVD